MPPASSTSPPETIQAQAPTPEPEPRESHAAEIMFVAMQGLGYALSARALLLLALIGAFTIGFMAMLKGNWMALAILAVYAVLTVIPMVVLEIRKR